MKLCQAVIFISTLIIFFLSGCASKILEVENAEQQLQIAEYDKNIKLKELSPPETVLKLETLPAETVSSLEKVVEKQTTSEDKISDSKEVPQSALNEKTKESKTSKKIPAKIVKNPKKHLPEIEGQSGFDGRRPLIDPFTVGEKVRLKLSYYKLVAGYMDVEVLPFVQVNGKKSYHFRISGKTNSFFSSIYSVDDKSETFLDYETLLPYNMSVSVKETKQLREIRSYFDWNKNKASYWEKKITKKNGLEEKKFDWDILQYSQNIFSAVFYMRVFPLVPGTMIQFRVADNKKNMVVKAHILGREKLTTDLGEINTIKIRPDIEIDGIFKPIGEVYFWMTDDDRKMIVRVESSIKIGTIIASLAELKKE